ncbi:mannose-6-phosphate isomerase type 1 [Mesocricetibacter intestinalis]|uniref:mannose-6-phosphate isomerase n=1 Tax=Mesocricetibacter intestinalis TaxID=1521930 RepID=A0A4R6VBU2_9PAST|nr:mannose-6-phosphate isomerase, class I [Mesocricetibacter intestinalis]TDQ59687.1 mannose-6-phosphate isomerase type 1 [Mesocricetibacter intestinalis]
MSGIYRLKGSLQHYIWGGSEYIPQLLNQEKKQSHYAELWLGAHSSSPSIIEIEGQLQNLNEFLHEHPQALGQGSRSEFGNELPYLLKILDVAQPLSIQLHPTKQQAEAGFAAENAKGIPLTDPKRTYKDNNHKPEMMIALSDFWLLHGFKSRDKILQCLNARPSLQPLAQQLETQDLHSFYAHIMQADQAHLSAWLLPLIKANQAAYDKGELKEDNPDYWLLYCLQAMQIPLTKLDPGLICFYLFNIVHTKKGEGIFQDAGIPHAYLRGQNIELMACSDNVIRGGLTPKHVDIAALLQVVNCREVEPQIIAPAPQDRAGFTYPTPARDFALENIPYQQGESYQAKAENAAILLVMEGEIKIRQNSTALSLSRGESVFICADSQYQLEGLSAGYAVLAKLP